MENKKIVILVGCEESQTICKAFREKGFEAYSCDLQECSGGHPEWHLQMDVFKAIDLINPQVGIFNPPCDFLSNAGARWLYQGGILNQERYAKGLQAKEFFMKLLNYKLDFIAVENPLPSKIYNLPKYSQIVQPYQYGHEFSKRTLLWLKGLPTLKPTDIKESFVPYLPSNTGGAKRGQKATPKNITKKQSSKTFDGIAKAMAEQWGGFLHLAYTQERGLLT